MKNHDPSLVVMTRQAFDELYANAINNPFKKSSEALKGIHKHVRKKNPLLGAEWREADRKEKARISHEKKEAARVAGLFAGKDVYCEVSNNHVVPVYVLAPSTKVKGLVRVRNILNMEMEVHYSQLKSEVPDELRELIKSSVYGWQAEILGYRGVQNGARACLGDHDGDRPISHGPRY